PRSRTMEIGTEAGTPQHRPDHDLIRAAILESLEDALCRPWIWPSPLPPRLRWCRLGCAGRARAAGYCGTRLLRGWPQVWLVDPRRFVDDATEDPSPRYRATIATTMPG